MGWIFFRRFQALSICKDVEDKMVSLNLKCGNFLVKSLYTLSNGRIGTFLSSIVWNPCDLSKAGFFLLGKLCGE